MVPSKSGLLECCDFLMKQPQYLILFPQFIRLHIWFSSLVYDAQCWITFALFHIHNYLPTYANIPIHLPSYFNSYFFEERADNKISKDKGIPSSPELLRKSIAEIMPLLSHWRKTTGLSLCSWKFSLHSKSEADLGYEGGMIICTVVKKSSNCTSYT